MGRFLGLGSGVAVKMLGLGNLVPGARRAPRHVAKTANAQERGGGGVAQQAGGLDMEKGLRLSKVMWALGSGAVKVSSINASRRFELFWGEGGPELIGASPPEDLFRS